MTIERAPLVLRLAIPGALVWLGATGAWFESRVREVRLARTSFELWTFGAAWSALLAIVTLALLTLALRRNPRARTGILAFAAVLIVYRFARFPVFLAMMGYGDFGAVLFPLVPVLAPVARELLMESVADMAYASALVTLTLHRDVLAWLARREF